MACNIKGSPFSKVISCITIPEQFMDQILDLSHAGISDLLESTKPFSGNKITVLCNSIMICI